MIDIQENVPLAPFTTFRIGGPAKYFVEVATTEELKEAVQYAKERNIAWYVLAGGSNVLVGDKGFDGLVIKMKLGNINQKDSIIEAEAGVPLIKLINTAAASGLSGVEMLAGIPGTVGGAVRGNAGAYGGMIGNVVENVLAFDGESGELKTFSKEQCEFEYRSSMFKKNSHYVVVSVRIKLEKGDSEQVRQKTKDIISQRVAKELSGDKSAGSYFMNPVVSDKSLIEKFEKDRGIKCKDDKLPAGWLVDQCDLRGKKMGGAMISEKHANYIINTGDATAEDVIMLESYVKQQVRDQLGVQLQSEVNHVGF